MINKFNHRHIPIQAQRVFAIREVIDRAIRNEPEPEPPPKYEQLELKLLAPPFDSEKDKHLKVIARLRKLIRRSNTFVLLEGKSNARDFAHLWALCSDNPKKWGLPANWRSYLAGHARHLNFQIDYGRVKSLYLNKHLVLAVLDASSNLLTKRNIVI
mgnify:CR=1 FL=1